MKFIADLHIHSRFSRATSKDLTLPNLYKWGQYKGVNVIGTGDFTHPAWFAEIKECLVPDGETGLFRLRDDLASKIDSEIPEFCRIPVRFMLTVEISNIYKRHGKTRKVHNVVCAPDIETVAKINMALGKIGNLKSDGRPILGLDSRDLLEIVIQSSEESYLIPAHIWTPWFSMLGSKSGFDSVEECFGDLTPYIFAAETGLSSDPAMNWRCSRLDGLTLVSNSDAHSPSKLAREANVFDTEMDYRVIFDALKKGDSQRFLGTIEFYPEEGKYHLDGHRKCQTRMEPEETISAKGLCPVCKKPVTVGVMHRVNELADRKPGEKPEKTYPFDCLVGLQTTLSQILESGVSSKKVLKEYYGLLQAYGTELHILQETSIEEIERKFTPLIAEGIRRVRSGELYVNPGFDGEFGTIELFKPEERQKFLPQPTFFQNWEPEADDLFSNTDTSSEMATSPEKTQEAATVQNSQMGIDHPKENEIVAQISTEESTITPQTSEENPKDAENLGQQQGISHRGSPLLIVAGPGTGKTRTLTHRLANLIATGDIAHENILAVTFTNKASQEMRERLAELLGEEEQSEMQIFTFHQLGLSILRTYIELLKREASFSLYSQEEILQELQQHQDFPDSIRELKDILEGISYIKANLQQEEEMVPEIQSYYEKYQAYLENHNIVDFDDLICLPIKILQTFSQVRQHYHELFKAVAVDEYQDINKAQYCLLRFLLSPQCDICVIGDPDQAIYGFRGSDVRYFLQFDQDFSNTCKIVLEQNYRSAQIILDAAHKVISKNSNNTPKLIAQTSLQGRIELVELASERAEAEFIVHSIEKLLGGVSEFSLDSHRADKNAEDHNWNFSDFAVLFRTHQQSKAIEEAFVRLGIPYQIVGAKSYLDRSDVKLFKNFLQIICYPECEREYLQIFASLPGIGSKSLKTIQEFCAEQQQPVYQLRDAIQYSEISVNVQNSLRSFYDFVLECRQICQDFSVSRLLENIEKHDVYGDIFSLPSEILNMFSDIALVYPEICDFLDYLALVHQQYHPKADKVTIMSLHASKGLEFATVYITGCEEGIIPYQKRNQPSDIEEERRLFYVGMTRAKERLYLTHCKKRVLAGKFMENPLSSFVEDIPKKWMTMVKKTKIKEKPQQLSFFE